MQKVSRKVLFSLLLLSSFLMTACQTTGDTEKEQTQEKKQQEEKAPEQISDIKVSTITGDEIYLHNVLAQTELTVVNIWSPSCSSCEDTLHILEDLNCEYTGNGVQIAGIISGISDPRDEETLAMIERAGVNYTQILDSAEVTKQFLNDSAELPVTLFIDWKGNLLGQVKSSDMTAAQWKEEIDKYHAQICVNNHPPERGRS